MEHIETIQGIIISNDPQKGIRTNKKCQKITFFGIIYLLITIFGHHFWNKLKSESVIYIRLCGCTFEVPKKSEAVLIWFVIARMLRICEYE